MISLKCICNYWSIYISTFYSIKHQLDHSFPCLYSITAFIALLLLLFSFIHQWKVHFWVEVNRPFHFQSSSLIHFLDWIVSFLHKVLFNDFYILVWYYGNEYSLQGEWILLKLLFQSLHCCLYEYTNSAMHIYIGLSMVMGRWNNTFQLFHYRWFYCTCHIYCLQ